MLHPMRKSFASRLIKQLKTESIWLLQIQGDMKYDFCFYVSLCILLHLYYCQDENEPQKEKVTFCRERNRPIGTERSDLYHLVEVFVGQKISLQCHYCEENDDQKPKVWYKSTRLLNSTRVEIQLDMDNNVSLSRIHVNPEHSLIIHNVTTLDTSYYFCLGFEAQDLEDKFNYYLDVVDGNETTVETGNLSDWRTYQENNFFPINKLFRTSKGPEFVYLRDRLLLILEVMTTWDPWGECEVCGRPQGEGIRRKKGHCRLKITAWNSTVHHTLKGDEKLLANSTEVGCRSRLLNKLVPGIFNLTKYVPDFMQSERCTGTCNPDAEGKYKGWKSTKKTGYKYRKTFVLAENAHLTIVCPESTLENVVEWSLNGRALPPGESVAPPVEDMEPKITVDTFNTLYLHEVTKAEEGNYTCQVDKIRMQQVMIFVVSKSRLLTQTLLRHMMYLGFILSLTLSCYFAGLVVTWTRRHKFKSYREVRKMNKHKEDHGDESDEKM